jgi:hypothetical protein
MFAPQQALLHSHTLMHGKLSDDEGLSAEEYLTPECQSTNLLSHAKRFQFRLTCTEYNDMIAKRLSRRFGDGWTLIFYEHFRTQWPGCAVKFNGNWFKKPGSRNTTAPFWRCTGRCQTSSDCITFEMMIQQQPLEGEMAVVDVVIHGDCKHIGTCDDLSLVNRRHLSGAERKKAVTQLRQTGQSAHDMYLARLGRMNEEECVAGNTTSCQTAPVYRQAAYEARRRDFLHDNMILELEAQYSSFNAAMPGRKLMATSKI